LTLILTSIATLFRKGCPISRVLCEKWETTAACSAVVAVAFARVERTLLSAAFDFDLALDFDFDSAQRGKTRKGTTISRAETLGVPWKTGRFSAA
jgi:hypothetical protein